MALILFSSFCEPPYSVLPYLLRPFPKKPTVPLAKYCKARLEVFCKVLPAIGIEGECPSLNGQKVLKRGSGWTLSSILGFLSPLVSHPSHEVRERVAAVIGECVTLIGKHSTITDWMRGLDVENSTLFQDKIKEAESRREKIESTPLIAKKEEEEGVNLSQGSSALSVETLKPINDQSTLEIESEGDEDTQKLNQVRLLRKEANRLREELKSTETIRATNGSSRLPIRKISGSTTQISSISSSSSSLLRSPSPTQNLRSSHNDVSYDLNEKSFKEEYSDILSDDGIEMEKRHQSILEMAHHFQTVQISSETQNASELPSTLMDPTSPSLLTRDKLNRIDEMRSRRIFFIHLKFNFFYLTLPYPYPLI